MNTKKLPAYIRNRSPRVQKIMMNKKTTNEAAPLKAEPIPAERLAEIAKATAVLADRAAAYAAKPKHEPAVPASVEVSAQPAANTRKAAKKAKAKSQRRPRPNAYKILKATDTPYRKQHLLRPQTLKALKLG